MKKIFSAIAVTAAAICMPAASHAIDPLEALGGIVNAVTKTTKFEVSSLEGSWTYKEPAVTFKSDNTTGKIGGAAGSVVLVNKLTPYYKQLGLDQMTLDVTPATEQGAYDFVMKIRGITLKGNLTKDSKEDELLDFNFSAFGKVKLGKLSAKAEKSAAGILTLTFDASRFISILDKVAGVTNISTIKAITGLLESYDGIYIGAKLSKVRDSKGSTAK